MGKETETETEMKVRISLEVIERNNPMMPSSNSRMMMSGVLAKRGTGYLVSYDEDVTEDHLDTDRTKVYLHLTPDRVMMMREGSFSTTLVFARKQHYEGSYNTPFGEMPISVQTRDVVCVLGEKAGNMHLEYEISIGGQDPLYRIMNLYYDEE
ncbi:MAG: DUF1934 domain-containing protein [Clostridia bacterium]|nr:DUF1934 domain-containing protein [Clostridia bacterium]